jgi:hypothetical protein
MDTTLIGETPGRAQPPTQTRTEKSIPASGVETGIVMIMDVSVALKVLNGTEQGMISMIQAAIPEMNTRAVQTTVVITRGAALVPAMNLTEEITEAIQEEKDRGMKTGIRIETTEEDSPVGPLEEEVQVMRIRATEDAIPADLLKDRDPDMKTGIRKGTSVEDLPVDILKAEVNAMKIRNRITEDGTTADRKDEAFVMRIRIPEAASPTDLLKDEASVTKTVIRAGIPGIAILEEI